MRLTRAITMTVTRWLPVDYGCGEDGVRIRWMDFGATLPAEPFFYQTLQRLRTSRPPAREGSTGIKSLTGMARQFDDVSPAGVIFHISRCGSTVVSATLGKADNVVVLAEARPIAMFSDPAVAEVDRASLLDSVVRLYAHPGGADAHRVIIKCHTMQTWHILRMREVWPDVPFLVVIRDPVEVMVSNWKLPAGWLRAREKPSLRGLFTSCHVEEMTVEEYAARCIGRFCESALCVAGPNCRILDYEDLGVAALRRVAAYFEIELPAALNLEDRLARYAKDPEGVRSFRDDRADKQRDATHAIRQAVREWALEPYQALHSLRGFNVAIPE